MASAEVCFLNENYLTSVKNRDLYELIGAEERKKKFTLRVSTLSTTYHSQLSW